MPALQTGPGDILKDDVNAQSFARNIQDKLDSIKLSKRARSLMDSVAEETYKHPSSTHDIFKRVFEKHLEFERACSKGFGILLRHPPELKVTQFALDKSKQTTSVYSVAEIPDRADCLEKFRRNEKLQVGSLDQTAKLERFGADQCTEPRMGRLHPSSICQGRSAYRLIRVCTKSDGLSKAATNHDQTNAGSVSHNQRRERPATTPAGLSVV